MAGAPRQGSRGEVMKGNVAKGCQKTQSFPLPLVAAKHREHGGVGIGRVKQIPKAEALLTFPWAK